MNCVWVLKYVGWLTFQVIAFATNESIPVLEEKETPTGQQLRLDILQKYYLVARQVVEKFLADFPYRKKIDDVIDALCLAITGMLGLEHGFMTITECLRWIARVY